MEAGEKYRVNLVRKTALLAALVTCSGALLMFVFGQQAIQLTYIAAFACLLMLSLYTFIYFRPYNAHNGIYLMLGIIVAVLLPTTFTGAANSRFSVIIPILPIMMCLILNRRSAIVLSGILLVCVLAISLFNDALPDFTNLVYIEQEKFAKTLWLIMATLLGLSFALVFIDINSKLTVQLEDSKFKNSDGGIYSQEGILSYAENILYKFVNNKNVQKHLCLAVLELKDKNTSCLVNDSQLLSDIGRSIGRIVKQDTDAIGSYKNHQILICMQSLSSQHFDNICTRIANQIQTDFDFLEVNIGFIHVDKKVAVNLSSLLAVAQIALRRSKRPSEFNVINSSKMKKA